MDPNLPGNNPANQNQNNDFVEPSQIPNNPSPNSNAFTALTDKVGVPQGLNNADIPKKFAKYQAMKGMLVAVPMFLIGLVIAAIVYKGSHNQKSLLLVLVADVVISGSIFLMSFVSYRQLKKAQAQPNQFNQFQTGTAVTYKTPLATAVIAPDENIGGWLGPVNTGGKQGISVQVLSHESDHQSINTLIFTNKQIVAVLLGPQDVPSSVAGGILNQVASSTIQYSDQGANPKNEEFVVLYSRKWEAIMQNLLAKSLQDLPQDHLTYGIPFDQIEHIEIRRSMINPGLVIYMKDGKKLTYPTLRKDLLDQAQNSLQQYVRVQ